MSDSIIPAISSTSLPYQIWLGSQSPRRKDILTAAGVPFTLHLLDVDESLEQQPNDLAEIPKLISEMKSHAYGKLPAGVLLLTADTVVLLDNQVLGKPKNREHAMEMLGKLSGRTHTVVTGFTIRSQSEMRTESVSSQVTFGDLTLERIEYYVDHYAVLDKAAAYGIQDWIGCVAIERIEGSYYNVMGLPIHRVLQVLREW